jgi:dTDP-4-amino-4,6-dideoxygalactose transaminase
MTSGASEPLAFPPWPVFEREEILSATRVLESGKINYWTGEEGRRFEDEFARAVGTKHAVALANGTVALELALWALGIGPGDEVITTPRTFIASASAVVMRGARPVFVDVDPVSQNITAATIAPAITPRTKAIVAVHLAGWPCEMDAIMALAEQHGLKVIEDCAQAHGARYRGRSVGALGHVAAWSFCQDKIMSTGGEGGMLTTDDPEIWARAWSRKDHGKSYDAVYNRQHPAGFRWLHEDFGTNWRMLEVQAAIGRILLRKLDLAVAKRQQHAAFLNQRFERHRLLRVTRPPAHVAHSYYKHYVFVRPELLRDGWSRDRIMGDIAEQGIPCQSGSCSEIYREQAFIKHGLAPAQPFAIARELGETSLMFLVHPTIEQLHLEAAAAAVDSVVARASL